MANVKKYSRSANGNTNLSDNFKVKEFRCKDGSDSILIDLEMIHILQKIRDIGGPVSINSAYRTATYNKKLVELQTLIIDMDELLTFVVVD